MTALRQAATLALKALDKLSKLGNGSQDGNSLGNTIAQEAREHLFTALAQPEQEPSQWRDMVVVNLVREGINKHKARDLADHFATPPPAAQPEQEPMTEVADRFAHRMALELECVLSDGAYSNKWYTSAMQVLSEYRSAMNEIHEKHSPTFIGEPHSLEERHTAEKRDRQNAAHSRAINAAHKVMICKTCERCGAELMSDMTNTCYQCNQE